MKNLISLILVLIAIAGLCNTIAFSKNQTPEFYGIYLVSKSKLIELKDAKEERRLKTVGNMLIAKNGIKTLSGIDIVDKNVHFIVYLPNLAIGSIRLAKLNYISSLILGRKGDFLNPQKEYEAKMWVKDSLIKLRFAPVGGKQDMYRAVPVANLTDGVYALTVGGILSGQGGIIGAISGGSIADFSVNFKEGSYRNLTAVALHIINSFPSKSFRVQRVDSLSSIANLLAKEGKIQKAEELLNQALDITKTMTESSWVWVKATSIAKVAVGIYRNGKNQKGLDLIRSISEKSVRSKGLKDIALYLISIGKINQALEIVPTISDREASLILYEISKIYGRSGDDKKSQEMFDKALKYTDEISGKSVIVFVKCDMAKKIHNDGQKKKARDILDSAIKIANSIAETENKAGSLITIAFSLNELGYKQHSEEILNQSIVIAKSIKRAYGKDNSLGRIAGLLYQSGKPAQANKIIDIIKYADVKNRFYSQKVYIMAEFGKIEEALEQAKKWKLNAIGSISLIIAKKGNYPKALELSKLINDRERRKYYLLRIALRALTLKMDKKQQTELANNIMSIVEHP